MVDASRFLAFAKLYLSKLPMPAVDLLNDRVLPFYEERGILVEDLLADNGREFFGRPLQHPYELFLAIHQTAHRNTKAHAPHTDGFYERFHRTVSDEFFKVTFRKEFYLSLAEFQENLDAWLEMYNTSRSHYGYRTRGRPPLQGFDEGLGTQRKEVTAAE